MIKTFFDEYIKINHFLYEFTLSSVKNQDGCQYCAEFKIRQQPIIKFSFAPILSEKENAQITRNGFPVEQFYIAIARALLSDGENEKNGMESIITHHTEFTTAVIITDSLTIKSFANFTKALIEVVSDQQDVLMKFFSDMPNLCSNVIKLERDAFPEKVYLEKIITYEREHSRQFSLFSEVIQFPYYFFIPSPEDKKKRIVSFITEYWLNLYDFDRAADIIETSKIKSPFLWAITSVYKHYHLIGPLFIVLSLLLINNWEYFLPLTKGVALGIVSLIFLITLVGLVRNDNIRILRLVLPRMIAAITAGFAVFVPNPEPWKWGAQLGIERASLIILFTYVGSLVYLFLEVDTTQKFIADKSKKDVWRSVRKLFMIGLTQAFLVGIVLYSLLSPIMIGYNSDKITLNIGFPISITSACILLCVWSGIALFLGAFIELIWESGRITDSI